MQNAHVENRRVRETTPKQFERSISTAEGGEYVFPPRSCSPLQDQIPAQARNTLPQRVLTPVAEQVLYLSFVAASVAFTVTETKLFKPFRETILRKNSFLGELVSCGYCLGHWVAFALAAIYRPRVFTAWWPLDYTLTALIIAWLAAFQWALLCLLVEKSGK